MKVSKKTEKEVAQLYKLLNNPEVVSVFKEQHQASIMGVLKSATDDMVSVVEFIRAINDLQEYQAESLADAIIDSIYHDKIGEAIVKNMYEYDLLDTLDLGFSECDERKNRDLFIHLTNLPISSDKETIIKYISDRL